MLLLLFWVLNIQQDQMLNNSRPLYATDNRQQLSVLNRQQHPVLREVKSPTFEQMSPTVERQRSLLWLKFTETEMTAR